MNMKSTVKIIAVVCLLCAASAAFAQEAVIKELSGTVELKREGSALWQNAVQGQAITGGTIVSTGFKSSALISVGSSMITVRPLTRLSLAELRTTSQGTETINVSLQAGRVRADVKAPAGARADFTVQTPAATASVRGTVFEIGAFGLWVHEGSIEYNGSSGAPVIVDAGKNSYVDNKSGKTVSITKETLIADLSPPPPLAVDRYIPSQGAALQPKSDDINISGELHFGE